MDGGGCNGCLCAVDACLGGRLVLRARAPGFLGLLWFARRYACVRVCVSVPGAINNQWRDIGRVRLVKQVLQLFPAFNT